jgi:serine protease Do
MGFMNSPFVLSAGCAALLAFQTAAETIKDRAGAVLGDRAKMQAQSQWIYNDWRKGFTEAKDTGKPLLIVLRCVPCLACMGIDAGVLTQPELTPLLSQFVRVRVINANDLDLSLFQFDYDLSFSTLFFNGDGTVYGRYGSWQHQKNSQDTDTASFKAALEAALQVHAGYPANKPSLAGKQGVPLAVTDPLKLPQLSGKYQRSLDWEGKVVQSCVHCHQISDANRTVARQEPAGIPERWVYPMPAPETVGLVLAQDRIAKVESVLPNSSAARAGFQAGDEILALSGQPLLSIADAAWVLHQAPDIASIPATIRRAGTAKNLTLSLASGWRAQSDISRRVGTWEMRAMALGGLSLEDLPDAERSQRGLSTSEMGLLVKHAGEYGTHAAAKKAGFQKGDILVQVDGHSRRTSESWLIGHLLRQHRAGESVPATVLRDKARLSLKLPMQ